MFNAFLIVFTGIWFRVKWAFSFLCYSIFAFFIIITNITSITKSYKINSDSRKNKLPNSDLLKYIDNWLLSINEGEFGFGEKIDLLISFPPTFIKLFESFNEYFSKSITS